MVVKTELAVIRHYIERARFDGRLIKLNYFAAVADTLMETIPETERTTTRASGRGVTKWEFKLMLKTDCPETLDAKRKYNAKKVEDAVLHGVTMPPVFMRRALLVNLPEPYQTSCLRELYRAEGNHYMPLLDTSKAQDHAAIHEQFAGLVRALGAVLQNDGLIDDNDSLDALEALRDNALNVVEVGRRIALQARHAMTVKLGTVVDIHGGRS